MTLQEFDYCFIPSNDWLKLETYHYVGCDKEGIHLHLTTNNTKTTVNKGTKLVPHPSDTRFRKSHPKFVEFCKFVLDSASSLISSGKLEVSDLIEKISNDNYLPNVKHVEIEFALKCYVANETLIAIEAGTKKNRQIFLKLSEDRLEREKTRRFAGSMASELKSLSERIRLLISHAPTVGTYRESILKTVLEKHLPERYHVATGFIYGCDRQIDILIYDRIEYAPLFRESDLVVVPASAVRAVIEVKTNLTTEAFRNSLGFITDIGCLDSGYPPIFKGIFAFESDANEDTLCEILKEHHSEDEIDSEDEQLSAPIDSPFDHLTCACINEKHFIYTTYQKSNINRYIPILIKTSSHTGLKNQVALFMEQLLSHLQFGGAKPGNFHSLQNMLGSDTRTHLYAYLAPESWGPYLLAEHGDDIDAVRMNEKITNVMQWLDGEIAVLPPLKEEPDY